MKELYRKFFFHSSILTTCLLFIINLVILLWQKCNFSNLLFVVMGVFVFIIIEYLSHRFLFHSKPPKHPFLFKMAKRLHYDHHEYPNDFNLLFLPLWYTLPNLFLLSVIFYFIDGNLTNTISFVLGLIGCLIFYEWKHYIAHQPLKPKTSLGRWNKKNHILHHFKNENYWFGVSSPLIDILLGTLKDEKEVETSKTAKNLENRNLQS